MRFLLDNNISPLIAEALNALTRGDPAVQSLRSKFSADTPDTEWIRVLAEEGDWVIVSADQRILKRRAERDVFRAAHLTAFFLAKGWSHQKFWLCAEHLVRWWPTIMSVAQTVAAPQAYEVPFRGAKLRTI